MSRDQGTSESGAPRIPRVVALLMDGMWAHDLANVIQVFGNGAPLKGQALRAHLCLHGKLCLARPWPLCRNHAAPRVRHHP